MANNSEDDKSSTDHGAERVDLGTDPDQMTATPRPVGPPRQTEFQRLVKRLQPALEKTKVDFEACRDVVTRIAAGKVKDLDKEAFRSEPGSVAAQAPTLPYKKQTACPRQWEMMSGTDQYRLCEQCQLFAYDFNDMSLSDAQQVVFKREGKPNAFFYRRPDGRFLTTDCPESIRKERAVPLMITAAGLSMVFLILLCCFSFSLASKPQSAKQSSTDNIQSGASSVARRVVTTTTTTAGHQAQNKETSKKYHFGVPAIMRR